MEAPQSDRAAGIRILVVMFLGFACVIAYLLVVWLPSQGPPKPMTIRELEGMTLLWEKRWELKHQDFAQKKRLYIPDDEQVVTWVPDAEPTSPGASYPLRSLDILSGETIWQADAAGLMFVIPHKDIVLVMARDAAKAVSTATGQTLWTQDVPTLTDAVVYKDRLYVLSSMKLDAAPLGPGWDAGDCHIGGEGISVLALDAYSGAKVWAYAYQDFPWADLTIKDGRVVLAYHVPRSNAQTIAHIDPDTGLWLDKICYDRGPSCPQIADGEPSPDMKKYGCLGFCPGPFKHLGRRLDILELESRQVLGSIVWDRTILYDVDVAVHNDLVVVHFDESEQFFGFRLDQAR